MPQEFRNELLFEKWTTVAFIIVAFVYGIYIKELPSPGEIAICIMLLGILNVLITIGKRIGGKQL